MTRIVALFVLCMVLAAGCARTDEESSGKTRNGKKPPQEKPLAIGLTPEHQIFAQVERYEPLAKYLSEKLGRKIKMMILPRYGNIVDNFVSAQMDGAFFGSFTYALAHQKLGVEVLARPICLDGVSTYHGLILVRKDSGIKTAKGMKGKRFAFVDKATTAGYLLPLAYFKDHGIKNYRSYFKETYFTGTHEDAIYDVLNKKADICAAKNTVFNRLAAADRRIKEELDVLDRSPDVPENGLAVRRDLEASIRDKLKETLLNMHEDPAGKRVLKDFGSQQFIETTDRDYEPVYDYAREIGLNLATYDYVND